MCCGLVKILFYCRLHKLEQVAGVRDEEAFRRLQAVTGQVCLNTAINLLLCDVSNTVAQ